LPLAALGFSMMKTAGQVRRFYEKNIELLLLEFHKMMSGCGAGENDYELGVFFSSTWLFVVAAFFFASGFFWSPFFYALLFFFGLRKKGYKGRIRFVSLGKAFGVARCGTE